MPDVFLPLDTSVFSEYFRTLLNKGNLNLFVLDCFVNHKHNVRKYADNFDEFDSKYSISDEMLNDYWNYLQTAIEEERGNTPDAMDHQDKSYCENTLTLKDSIGFKQSANILKTYTKALIARFIWDNNEYYRILSTNDAAVKSAVNYLTDTSLYDLELSKTE